MNAAAQHTVIRKARPEEEKQIGELLVEAFVVKYAQKMPEVVVSEERKRDLRDVLPKCQTACVLVAELEGKIIGTVTLFPPGHSGSESWTSNAACLRYLAVDLKFHRMGVSDLLLNECVHIAKSWHCDAIELHIRRGATGIGKFYERLGYARESKGDLDLLPEIFLEGYRLKL